VILSSNLLTCFDSYILIVAFTKIVENQAVGKSELQVYNKPVNQNLGIFLGLFNFSC